MSSNAAYQRDNIVPVNDTGLSPNRSKQPLLTDVSVGQTGNLSNTAINSAWPNLLPPLSIGTNAKPMADVQPAYPGTSQERPYYSNYTMPSDTRERTLASYAVSQETIAATVKRGLTEWLAKRNSNNQNHDTNKPDKNLEGMTELEAYLFKRVNQIRKEHGLNELAYSKQQQKKAERNSDLIDSRGVGHWAGPGYEVAAWAMRLGGMSTEQAGDTIINMWRNSPAHWNIILSRNVVAMGAGTSSSGATISFSDKWHMTA